MTNNEMKKFLRDGKTSHGTNVVAIYGVIGELDNGNLELRRLGEAPLTIPQNKILEVSPQLIGGGDEERMLLIKDDGSFTIDKLQTPATCPSKVLKFNNSGRDLNFYHVQIK